MRTDAITASIWHRTGPAGRLVEFREAGRVRTRKRRVSAPTNDTLYVALVDAQAAATTEKVIEWAGNPVVRVKRVFRDAAVTASLGGVMPHVPRHTAVAWMPKWGVDPWKAAGLVGMTVDMVRQVYGHHHPVHLRDAARALG